jgi:hypothetical protein
LIAVAMDSSAAALARRLRSLPQTGKSNETARSHDHNAVKFARSDKGLAAPNGA